MAATLTGTPTAVAWAAGSNPAGQSITIPADATAVYMFWSFWRSTSGLGLLSATLGGNNPSQTFELPTVNNPDDAGTGVAAWYNPTTGSQTLDPAWDGIPTEGPTTIVAYVKGGNTTAWRDADADAAESTTAVTVTLTTVSGDLVLKYDSRFSTNVTQGTGVPALSADWASANTQDRVDKGSRLSSITATGVTQVCDSETEYYSSVVAISIPSLVTGNPAAAAYYYRMNA